ncbi:MAG: ABC transporter substrate-binding protein, partial [Proteobacteria bacterium]|nr:ABC transporter substrate-binding protein [Pseudomonadota bacterium]
VQFRRALSLAINRHEINQAVYFGLTLEGNNTVLPDSGLYQPEYREKWATFDLKKANAMLDALGLEKRNDRGIRLLPDGRPMEIIIETSGEDGAGRRFGAGSRHLEGSRNKIVYPSQPARGFSQSDIHRRNIDVGLVRTAKRATDPRLKPGRTRPNQPAASAMAEMGPVFPVARRGR